METTTNETRGFWDDAEVISSYSRAQTMEDGDLVDVTEWAKETGYKVHTVVTHAVHQACCPPKSNHIESYRGRMHDVLWMGFLAMRAAAKRGTDRVAYKVKIGRKNHIMMVHVGPGDDPEPVITIGYREDF